MEATSSFCEKALYCLCFLLGCYLISTWSINFTGIKVQHCPSYPGPGPQPNEVVYFNSPKDLEEWQEWKEWKQDLNGLKDLKEWKDLKDLEKKENEKELKKEADEKKELKTRIQHLEGENRDLRSKLLQCLTDLSPNGPFARSPNNVERGVDPAQ